ncbi:MAG: hypothetical protein HY567_01000 [Candidatus Kerfeldbacteria bacterium]|nr:hypothetical protein [Candidatus Kerfeldbacteria bacterium]
MNQEEVSEQTPAVLKVGRSTYVGVFLVTLATLMYELLLTRLFSVVLWYHFAFMAVSLALFGMTLGAILVYLQPQRFRQERTIQGLVQSAMWFGLSVAASLVFFVWPPPVQSNSIIYLFVAFTVTAVPFVCSGICVTLALTRFPRQVGKVYASDLAGAGTGCLMLLLVLGITDALTTMVVVAAIACFAAWCFGYAAQRRLSATSAVLSSVLVVAALTSGILSSRQLPPLRLQYVKGQVETQKQYEKWNTFSRIAVYGNQEEFGRPVARGVSSELLANYRVRQLLLNIDASAATQLVGFDGNLEAHRYLADDVTNVAHHMRPDSDVLVIGAGGGRDVLSALLFKQRSIVAVELNKDIIETVNGRYGDFTGHLDRFPNVSFVNDEARSYLRRQQRQFDIIQVSLIDTWAATSAGAFSLTENSLYTREAWGTMLDRLTPTGLLSFSRWYHQQRPEETYRLIALAASALRERGVQNPRDHMLVVRSTENMDDAARFPDIASLVVSPSPLTGNDLDVMRRVAEASRFSVILSPEESLSSKFTVLADGGLPPDGTLDLSPPTDDRPFFFQMLRLRDAIRPAGVYATREVGRSSSVLASSLVIVVVLTVLCIVIPLMITAKNIAAAVRGSWHLLVFFAAIGLGFMMVEVSLLERLIIFLGHPVYSLSVVLFTLLLAAGLGSFVSQRLVSNGQNRRRFVVLSTLVAGLVIIGTLVSPAVSWYQASETWVRTVVAVVVLAPMGALMGTAFPLGMQLASQLRPGLTPWLWGVNGALSVTGSVVALVVAVTVGITAAFWTGVASYALAWLAFVAAHGSLDRPAT